MIKPSKKAIRALKASMEGKSEDPTKRLLKCVCGNDKRHIYRNDGWYMYECSKCGKGPGIYVGTMTDARVLWNNYTAEGVST